MFEQKLTGNKSSNDKAPVNHGVGEENEPAVTGARLELAARLGTTNTTSRILAYEHESQYQNRCSLTIM